MTGLEALGARFGPDECIVPPPPSAWTSWNGTEAPRPAALLLPSGTTNLQEMVRLCLANQIAMIPQGGGTGLSGGGWATGAEGRPTAVISLARMNGVLSIDAVDRVLTVGAGITVAAADAAAGAHGLCLPLTFGAAGTAQVGGAIATNAGGLRSWRHGSMRALVAGLEAVLADGSVWSGLRTVRKQTAGFDLSHLLIGSEGTLGIVTAAALRLAPPTTHHVTAVCAVSTPAAAVELFGRFRHCGSLEVIELISGNGIAHVVRAEGAAALPCAAGHPWYLLAEWGAREAAPRDTVEDLLGSAMSDGLILDGVLARGEADRARFWAIRESHGAACRRSGQPVQHDVALPLMRLPEFIARASEMVAAAAPGVECVPICHLGDCNVHFDLLVPRGSPPGIQDLSARIHDLSVGLGGTFSAEHGIGTAKRDELARLLPSGNLAAMRAIKAAFDPMRLMNPGKVL